MFFKKINKLNISLANSIKEKRGKGTPTIVINKKEAWGSLGGAAV